MASIVFHLALTLGVLWYQQKIRYKVKAWKLSILWYCVSAALVFIESFVLIGRPISGLLFQGLLLGIFYIPAVYLALRWAEARRHGLWGPMLVFLGLAAMATIVAAMFLARTPIVNGLDI